MGPKGEIERLSAGRMEIPLSEGIDGTMFEKFPWSRERYCEKRLIILSLPSSSSFSSSSSPCTPLFSPFRFSLLVLSLVCWYVSLPDLSVPFLAGISSRFRLGIIWLRDGIKWTIYDGHLGATIGRKSFSGQPFGNWRRV